MGSRANYVVVDADGWRLYYAHWGAQHIDRDLAAGPAEALRFVHAQRPSDPTDWLDDRWAEGAALLDLPRRRLVFFGADDHLIELPLRRAYLALLTQTWPGWTVRFAYDGLAELARVVGVDPAVVAVTDMRADWPDHVIPVADDHLAHSDWFLVTERDTDAVVRDKALDGRHPGWAGRRLLDIGPSASAVVATDSPVGGVHVDHGARRVGWWTTTAEPELRAAMVRAWSGWDVEFWDDDYERHVAEAGLPLPAIDVATGFDRWLDILTREYPDPVASFGSLVDMIRAEGRTVEVTAATSAHVEVERSAQTRADIVAALAAARRSVGL